MVGVVDCSAIQTTGSIVELVPRVSLRHRILNEVSLLSRRHRTFQYHSKELFQVEDTRKRGTFPSVTYNDKNSKLITWSSS
jgi:hypothetical protein